MASKKYYRQNETTSYSIAHHILMFLIVCLCVVGVVWLLVAWGYRNRTQEAAISGSGAPRVTDVAATPCAQNVTNAVMQMWTYNPSNVPMQYWEMAAEYVNGVVESRVTGVCNNVHFVCVAGQLRSDCDPCAVANAMSAAMAQHTADLVAQHCANE